ncbi:hypothetical protein NGC36_12715 [Serratia rubidaea]|uniref:hypothetical protein n=1 Tax=Serratia rubidaea TaxID=61652 RepID=UPI002DC049BC|nr:hypothetical protein [Serratia rubidaea]MEB7586133.1 hypothetical protein [Serratia rubidaea]
MKFEALVLVCYEEDDALTVALGDNEQSPVNYLIITRLDDKDNDSIDGGIGLQTSQSAYEASAAIEKVILYSDRLDVVITPDSHEHFGCSKLEGVFSETVRNTPEKIALLRKYLEAIFNGSKTTLIFS